jgi:hypothetical protein
MSVADVAIDVSKNKSLAEHIAALLTRNYSGMRARIRSLDTEIRCSDSAITLRLCYPAFRSGAPTIGDLVDTIALYIIPFALPRSQIAEVYKLYETVPSKNFLYGTPNWSNGLWLYSSASRKQLAETARLASSCSIY